MKLMGTNKSAKKPASGGPGMKLLITAASLAATLGGWALISGKETKPVVSAASVQVATPAVKIKLEPLPTLVPPITPQPQLVTINQPRPVVGAPPAAAVSASQPVAANEIVLRDVSAPALPDRSAPAPVVNTGSSR
jgi:hypothetical protein